MPGWLYERPPPLVLTASSPPGEILPPRRRPHPPLSAEAQILQEQHGVYGEGVVEHRHVDIFRAHTGHAVGPGPRVRGGRDRKVRHLAYVAVPVGLAGPQQVDGGSLRSLALSDLVTIAAPPPSVTRQQSRTLRGEETMREESTSSTVRSSRMNAFGLSFAHPLAATATSASCPRVVPYSCMWRDAARAYMLTG
jgi:hypothetical protein